jgi:hypothetical protein
MAAVGHESLSGSRPGDSVGIALNFYVEPALVLPVGYLSGSPLSSSATWDGATFKSLGVTSGVYKWTWPVADAFDKDDSFTLIAVPEPSTWIMMLAGFAGLSLAAWIKGRAVKSAA